MRTSRHQGPNPYQGFPQHHDEFLGDPEGQGRGSGRSQGGRRQGRGAPPYERGPAGRGSSDRGRGRGRRGRAMRGDVRAAILILLADEPMHGYQLMQAIADRSRGRWTPSPGAIYPALSQLEDEGLVTVTAESGRKVASLTDAGRTVVEARTEAADPFAAGEADDGAPDLRGMVRPVLDAARQVVRTGSDQQIAAAATILDDARRALYLLLADGPNAGATAPDTDLG